MTTTARPRHRASSIHHTTTSDVSFIQVAGPTPAWLLLETHVALREAQTWQSHRVGSSPSQQWQPPAAAHELGIARVPLLSAMDDFGEMTSEGGEKKMRNLPPDLPKSLDDPRRVPTSLVPETEMYDGWQG